VDIAQLEEHVRFVPSGDIGGGFTHLIVRDKGGRAQEDDCIIALACRITIWEVIDSAFRSLWLVGRAKRSNIGAAGDGTKNHGLLNF
jgi:hypothetical protein